MSREAGPTAKQQELVSEDQPVNEQIEEDLAEKEVVDNPQENMVIQDQIDQQQYEDEQAQMNQDVQNPAMQSNSNNNLPFNSQRGNQENEHTNYTYTTGASNLHHNQDDQEAPI